MSDAEEERAGDREGEGRGNLLSEAPGTAVTVHSCRENCQSNVQCVMAGLVTCRVLEISDMSENIVILEGTGDMEVEELLLQDLLDKSIKPKLKE